MNVLPKNNLIGLNSDSDDFGTVPFFYHIFCSWRRKERNPEERSFVFKSLRVSSVFQRFRAGEKLIFCVPAWEIGATVEATQILCAPKSDTKDLNS